MDFAAPADNLVKLKENEKIDKYHDIAREMKKHSDSSESVWVDTNREDQDFRELFDIEPGLLTWFLFLLDRVVPSTRPGYTSAGRVSR